MMEAAALELSVLVLLEAICQTIIVEASRCPENTVLACSDSRNCSPGYTCQHLRQHGLLFLCQCIGQRFYSGYYRQDNDSVYSSLCMAPMCIGVLS